MLSALPLSCLDVLVSVPLGPDSHQMNGANMDCVHNLLMYMERKLEQVKRQGGREKNLTDRKHLNGSLYCAYIVIS